MMRIRGLALPGLLLAAGMAVAQSPEPFDTFSDAACGISFRHPRSWLVVHNPGKVFTADYSGDQVACTIGLRLPDRTELLRVSIVVVRRPFLEVAQRAGFSRFQTGDNDSALLRELEDGDWMIAIRQGNAPAEQFRTACCQAVIGKTWGNTTAADGSRATFASTIAVVNDHRRHSAIIEGGSVEGAGAVVKEIAASVRFSP